MVSAASVFAIPELLEAILLELDMKTLLLSQAVNMKFHTMINGSIKLQRKLFFAPEPDHGQELKPNKLLEPSRQPPIYISCAPAFVYHRHYQYLLVLRGRGDYSGRLRHRSEYKMKEGSWQRMLLAQPPRAFANAILDVDGLATYGSDREGQGGVKALQTAGEVFGWVLRRRTP